MLEFLFVDLPLALAGYAAAVFIISRVGGLHDAGHPAEAPRSTSVDHTPQSPVAAETAAPVFESTTETWTVDHEPEGLTTLDDDDTAIFDPMTMVEFDSQDEDPEGHIPRDAVLRRHYLSHLRMMLETLNPEPTDATLRRHHLQHLDMLMERFLEDREAVEALEDAYEARHLSFH